MTSETRAALKHAVSEAQKRRWKAVRAGLGRCKGCDGDMLAVTEDCKQCYERAYQRRRRAQLLLEWSRSLDG